MIPVRDEYNQFLYSLISIINDKQSDLYDGIRFNKSDYPNIPDKYWSRFVRDIRLFGYNAYSTLHTICVMETIQKEDTYMIKVNESTEVTIYRNKRNPNKYIEVHKDGQGHSNVRQFMKFSNGVTNYTGDGSLHRWRKDNLEELLDDYELVTDTMDHFKDNAIGAKIGDKVIDTKTGREGIVKKDGVSGNYNVIYVDFGDNKLRRIVPMDDAQRAARYRKAN